MEILVIIMILTVTLGYLVEFTKSKMLKRYFLIGMFIFAFLYSGFRGKNVGIDTASWNYIFDNIAKYGIFDIPRNTKLEMGYMIINLLLSYVTKSSQSIIIVSSALISYAFYKLIVRYSKDYALSSLIFFSTIFTVTMNVSRQYMSLSLILFALPYLFDKKPRIVIPLVLLASTIHYSAIIFLPLTIFSFQEIDISRKNFFRTSLLALLIIPFYKILVQGFVSLFPQYMRFLESKVFSADVAISWHYVLLFIIVAILGLLCISPFKITLTKRKREPNNSKTTIDEQEMEIFLFFLIVFVEYIVIYYVSRNMYIATRLIYYFQYSLIIVIPNSIEIIRKIYKLRVSPLLLKMIFTVYFLYFGFNYLTNDPHGIFPYKLFWN